MDTAVGVWTLQLKFKTEKKRGQESIIIKIEQCWGKAFNLHGSYKQGGRKIYRSELRLFSSAISPTFLLSLIIPLQMSFYLLHPCALRNLARKKPFFR